MKALIAIAIAITFIITAALFGGGAHPAPAPAQAHRDPCRLVNQVVAHFGTYQGGPATPDGVTYARRYDLNRDGAINIQDIVLAIIRSPDCTSL